MQLESLNVSQLTPADALAIGELVSQTWPNPEKDAATRAKHLLASAARYNGPEKQSPRVFIVRDGDRVISHASIEPRTLLVGGLDIGSTEITVAALAKVCCNPNYRGQGLGALVVEGVFRLVDEGAFTASLFQTSHAVRSFYERLGACIVDEPIIDSTASDPTANPFWDDLVMRYPANGEWPAGEIDLRGPGY